MIATNLSAIDVVQPGATRRNLRPALTLRVVNPTILGYNLRSGVTVARLALNQLVKVQILAPQLQKAPFFRILFSTVLPGCYRSVA